MRTNSLKKSQAALEFLTTYGWAFLVILIMIGALAYFGILSPSKILPNRCNFGAEFVCVDYRITSGTFIPATEANLFKIKLKSAVDAPININSIILTTESTTAYACTLPTGAALPTNWGLGDIRDINWTCNNAAVGFLAGEKAKVLVSISYYEIPSGAGYSKQVKGDVYTSVI